MILLKNSKADFVQGTLEIGIRTTQWSFAVGERDWSQLQIQQGKVGTCSQGVGWGSADGNY